MYSVEYYNKTVIITVNNVRRLSLLNVDRLKNISIQVLKKQLDKLIIDLDEVTFIDSRAFEVLIFISRLSARLNVNLMLVNVHNEVKELMDLVDKDEKHLKVYSIENIEEIAGVEVL